MATYTEDTRIDGPSQGSPDAWYSWAAGKGCARPSDVKMYLDTVYEFAPRCNLKAELIVTQSIHETSMSGVPWASYWWKERCNPAGIGITGDPAQNNASRVFANGREAALAHIVHVYLYVHGKDLPEGLDPSMDPRWSAAAGVTSIVGQKKTLKSFGNAGETPTWAVDPKYGVKWAGWLNSTKTIFEGIDTPDEEKPPMAGYTVTWPGLPGGPITFSFKTTLNIVPEWRANRPGIKAKSPRKSVQHENGNRQAGAYNDSMYCFGGSGGRMASWHASIDHLGCYINLPADEVGWQAGDGSGPGNYNGFAAELCQLSYMLGAAEGRLARKNAAELMGRVAGARLNCDPPHQQHGDFMIKNCPEFLRNNPAWWAEYVKDWLFFRADERKRMAGGGGEIPEVVFGIGDTIGVGPNVRLNFRQAPATSAPIIATLDAGAELLVKARPMAGDGGYEWIHVVHQLNGVGVEGYVAKAGLDGSPWLVMVNDVADPPPPVEYDEVSPVTALLDTDLQKYDTAEGVVTENENQFIFVADVIEFTAPTKAKKWASEESPEVKAPYAAGDRVIAAWVVIGKPYVEDGVAKSPLPYYLLAGGDDEWVRVDYANTKRISDAPLLPGDEDKVGAMLAELIDGSGDPEPELGTGE